MRGYARYILLAGSVISASYSLGCNHTQKSFATVDPGQLSHYVRKGMTERDAIAFMERNRFACQRIENGNFTARWVDDSGKTHERTIHNACYLSCIRKDGGGIVDGGVVVAWHVAIVLNDSSNVVEVLSRRDLTGL